MVFSLGKGEELETGWGMSQVKRGLRILPLDGVWFKCKGTKWVMHNVPGVCGIGILTL